MKNIKKNLRVENENSTIKNLTSEKPTIHIGDYTLDNFTLENSTLENFTTHNCTQCAVCAVLRTNTGVSISENSTRKNSTNSISQDYKNKISLIKNKEKKIEKKI